MKPSFGRRGGDGQTNTYSPSSSPDGALIVLHQLGRGINQLFIVNPRWQ
jgi:hypothetical protein